MRRLSEELKRLNADTFRAEEKKPIESGDGPEEEWKPFLRRVLTSEFRIARFTGRVQDKRRMIAQIEADPSPYRRELVGELDGGEEDGFGVVISVVRLPSHPQYGGDRFKNIKVFARQAGEWKCAYWRVVRLPGAATPSS